MAGETARPSKLTREVFWTYAGYILASHVAFGGLALCRPELLADGSPPARAVCGLIAISGAPSNVPPPRARP